MRIELTRQAEDDLDQAFDHFFLAHLDLGAGAEHAFQLATDRIERSLSNIGRLAQAPGIGMAHEDLAKGLRHVTLDEAIYWFTPLADEGVLRVEGIFHTGQDHLRHIMKRLEGGTT